MALDPRIGPENPAAPLWQTPTFGPPIHPVTPLAIQSASNGLFPLTMDAQGRLIVSTVASGAGSDGTVTINALSSGVIGTVTIQATTLASGAAFAAMQPSPPVLFNGATVDLQRGNMDLPQSLITLATVLAGTSNSPDQLNVNARGIVLFPNITFMSGNPSVTFHVQGKDPVSAAYYSIVSTPAITTAAGLVQITAYPSIAVAAPDRVSLPLPRTWRVRSIVTAGSADSAVSATVGATTIV